MGNNRGTHSGRTPSASAASMSVSSLDEPDPADTRERIVRAARALFAERGYAATTMSAIASRAEVVRATVYNNFAAKIDILATIIQRYMSGYVAIGQQLRAAPIRQQGLFVQLEAMTRLALEWRVSNRDLRGVIDVARYTAGSGWVEADAEADAALLGWLSETHRASAAQGLVRADLDLDVATPAVYSMIEAALSNFDVATPLRRVRHVSHQLTLVHWRAIYRVEPDDVVSNDDGSARSGPTRRGERLRRTSN